MVSYFCSGDLRSGFHVTCHINVLYRHKEYVYKRQKEDGLPNNQFYWNASYYSPQNNLLYFGTINGLVAFTPDIAKTKKQDAKVKLTSISVAGTMVYPPADGKTPCAVTHLHTIRLHEKDHGFSIEFSTLNSVSYTHLDVYKRQVKAIHRLFRKSELYF